MSATLLFLQNAECQSLHRTAASHLCRAAVLPEVEGCLAGASLHRPPVQVHVCVRRERNKAAGLLTSSLFIWRKKMYSNCFHSQWHCRQSAVHPTLWKVSQSISHQSSQPEETTGNEMRIFHANSGWIWCFGSKHLAFYNGLSAVC